MASCSVARSFSALSLVKPAIANLDIYMYVPPARFLSTVIQCEEQAIMQLRLRDLRM